MSTLLSRAEVLVARGLDEALALRAAHPEAVALAGGTDLMVALEMGGVDPPRFLSLWGIDELCGVEEAEGGLWIGALTTYTDLIRDARVARSAPMLLEAARTVGALQIQNRGTLGGNIANASPAGDTLPVLLALDAGIEVASAARGRRVIPMEALYTGYRTLSTVPDELITRVWLPSPHPGDRTCFRKVGTRMAQSISKVVLGARVRLEGGEVTDARVALGSVAPTPVRCAAVEKALVGGPVDARAADAVLADIRPIDDVRSTAEYRRRVARNVLRSFLSTLEEA